MPTYAFTNKPDTTEFEAFTFPVPEAHQWDFIDALNDTFDWLGVKANNFQFDGDKVIVVVERPKK